MPSKLILVLFVLAAVICCVRGFVAPLELEESIRKGPKPSNAMVGFGGNKECVHANVTYGRRIPGDWKAFSHEFRKSSSFFFKTSVELKYPPNGSTSYCPISWINIENLYKKCKCYKEKVEIMAGGLGYKYVTLKTTTDTNCPNERSVTIYTRC